MSKRLNRSFDCKLNQNYKDALKYNKEKKIPDETILQYFGYSGGIPSHLTWVTMDGLRQDYLNDLGLNEWGDGNGADHSTYCCGIDELNFESLVGRGIFKVNNAAAKRAAASRIKEYANGDRRVLIVGLPLRKSGHEDSQYDFKQYQVLRRILLSFGFVQTHKRPYKNANSDNMLSVLVGQMP